MGKDESFDFLGFFLFLELIVKGFVKNLELEEVILFRLDIRVGKVISVDKVFVFYYILER